MAALLFPASWLGWLAFLSILLFIWWPPVPTSQNIFLFFFSISALILTVAVPIRGKYRAPRMAVRFLAWWLLLYFSTRAVHGVGAFFANLAINGASSTGIYIYGDYWGLAFAEFLISAILWLLVGVPQRAYWCGLGTDLADGARSLLVGLVTTAACVLSGIFIWLLINELTEGPIIAGIVFTVSLTPPYYSAVARACCQRGFFGMLSRKPLIKPWRQLVTQVQSARAMQAAAAREKALQRKSVASESPGWLDRAWAWARTRWGVLHHLMAQHHDFRVLRRLAPAQQDQPAEHPDHD